MAYAPFPRAIKRANAFLVGKPPGGPAPPPGKAGREVGPALNAGSARGRELNGFHS